MLESDTRCGCNHLRKDHGTIFQADDEKTGACLHRTASNERCACLVYHVPKPCPRCEIWAMYASAAAKALEPLGADYEFDDPDSLEGAITRLVKRVQV